MSDETTAPGPDWAALRALALTGAPQAEDVKARLPIAFVLEVAGVRVQPNGSRLSARCPFHDDEHPSFDVYGEHLDRWGCRPCGIGGDVLDLIGRLHGLSKFTAQLDKAKDLLDTLPPEWAPPPVTETKKVFDVAAAQRFVDESQVAGDEAVADYLDEVSARSPGLRPVPASWLAAEFRLGTDTAGRMLIPFYDRAGALVGYKSRATGGLPYAASGGSLGTLYGVWRDSDPSAVVVLCEGESDTWAAAYHLPEGYIALGLPTGAGAHPIQAPDLAGREVIVAFDGDDAGHTSALTWAAALRAEGADVSVSPLPLDQDIASLADPVQFVLSPRPLMPAPDAIIVDDGIYKRPGDKVDNPLSNWSLSPEVELRSSQGGFAYEGVLEPTGDRATISSFDLQSKKTAVAWSLRHGGAWYGGDRDTQQLLGLLQAQGPFLTPGRMETVAGLHEGHFIWPGGLIGPKNFKYVDPPNTVRLDQRMAIEPGRFVGQQVHALRALHYREVMDPVLAWLALAPLRSLFKAFPILGVTGSSGSGKTTLMETVLQEFTGTLITTNLTSTTPHALFSFVGSTNGFPVWFDEYRPGARKATLESLQQVIRDAYTGQASSKGGLAQSWSEVTTVPADCPLIVTGEDAFSETSHTERMILVHLPIKGKNARVLDDIRSWAGHGLPHGYLAWLHYMLEEELLDLTVTPDGPQGWPSRQRYNYGLLNLGWRILDQFVQLYGAESLGEPKWSRVHTAAQEATEHNPIQDALAWCLEEPDADAFINVDREGQLHVRVENFVTYVSRRGNFILPGGVAAVKRFLEEHYDARSSRSYFLGKQARAMVMPARHVGWGET